MAKYKITAPDGNSYEVTAPDTASQEEVLSYAKANYKGSATTKPSAFQRFGKYLPAAGGTLGGILGSELGPGAIGTAALGGAAGESARQLIGRSIGESVPQTSGQAAKEIGVQGGLNAAGEVGGQALGKIAGMAFKGFPKVGQMLSGTPAKNLVKAQERGVLGTYFPKVAKGMSRESAGAAQGAIEDQLLKKYYPPAVIVQMKLRKSGFADKMVQLAMTKQMQGKALSPKEALATVKSVDVIYRDTPLGSKVAPELAKLRQYADSIVSQVHPEYKAAKSATEATILRSQLSKPFRVNKTRPDEYSGFLGALAPMIEGVAYGTGGLPMAAKAAAGILGTSPFAMGGAAAMMGSIKNAVPPLARKAMQRSAIQSILQKLREDPNNNP